MRVGLFCKSFKADLGWLDVAVASFQKNWQHADTEFVVMLDRDCPKKLEVCAKLKVFHVEPWPDGYCHAMAMKLCADLFLKRSELIVMFDSDMELVRPTTLEDLLPCSRPVIYWAGWDDSWDSPTRAMARQVWLPAVERCTGRILDRDWMVSPRWVFWPSTFRGARALVEDFTGLPFLQAVYSSVPYDWRVFEHHPMSLCDMELLGLYAWEFERDRYEFRQWQPREDLAVRQSWSHEISKNL